MPFVKRTFVLRCIKIMISNKLRFYLIILSELVIGPWLYARNFSKWYCGKVKTNSSAGRIRLPVHHEKLSVCIHEWGGYEDRRKKNNKSFKEFECGLHYQLLRYQNYKGKYDVDVTVTVSESYRLKKKLDSINVLEVSNIGMDFSGYENFYNQIKHRENQYIILSNTSVNKIQVDFIDSYLDYFKQNSSIGILGVSVSSKMYQSFIKNNFNPHLQSFFLLTTIDVLREIVESNKGFPGSGIDHKLLLIRKGEVRLSQVALNLGYKLVCVLENGEPFYFDKSSFADNGRSAWHIPLGDYRLHVANPNAINPLKS